MKQELNSSQIKAVSDINYYLRQRKKVLKLISPAGYGKTFLIRKLIADRVFKNPLVIASTNQAVNLLRDNLNEGVTVKTIASSLNYVLTLTNKGYYLEQKKDPDWRSYDIVILDEGSQVSKDYFEQILTKSKTLIIAGDPLQLPPPGEKDSPCFSHEAPTIELTIPMRNTTGIFEYCTKIRASILDNKILPKTYNVDRTTFYKNLDSKLTDFMFGKAACVAFSENGAKYKKVRDLNAYIKEKLFNSDVDTFNKGEYIVFKKPFVPFVKSYETPDSSYQIYTHQRAFITDIHPSYVLFQSRRLKALLLTFALVEYPGVEFKGFLPIKDSSYDTCMHLAFGTRNKKIIDEFFSKWLDIKPAYAINAYACQGLSQETVFVDYSDISTCCKDNTNLKLRMLYVAASRATTNLNVLV